MTKFIYRDDPNAQQNDFYNPFEGAVAGGTGITPPAEDDGAVIAPRASTGAVPTTSPFSAPSTNGMPWPTAMPNETNEDFAKKFNAYGYGTFQQIKPSYDDLSALDAWLATANPNNPAYTVKENERKVIQERIDKWLNSSTTQAWLDKASAYKIEDNVISGQPKTYTVTDKRTGRVMNFDQAGFNAWQDGNFDTPEGAAALALQYGTNATAAAYASTAESWGQSALTIEQALAERKFGLEEAKFMADELYRAHQLDLSRQQIQIEKDKLSITMRGQDLDFASSAQSAGIQAINASLPYMAPKGTSADLAGIRNATGSTSLPQFQVRSTAYPYNPSTIGQEIAMNALKNAGSYKPGNSANY